jgi:hypothetical protein
MVVSLTCWFAQVMLPGTAFASHEDLMHSFTVWDSEAVRPAVFQRAGTGGRGPPSLAAAAADGRTRTGSTFGLDYDRFEHILADDLMWVSTGGAFGLSF